jgi:hypothetical protein
MNTSAVEIERPRAQNVGLTEDTLSVDLTDGRTISVPLGWYPRLQRGKPAERRNWRLIGDGEGVHWPDLDEDVSIANLLAGKHSGESPASFQRWMERRGSAEQILRHHDGEESVRNPKTAPSPRDPLANVRPRRRKIHLDD